MTEKKLRSAAVMTGAPVHRVFTCNDCGALLNQPVEKTGLYVLRGTEPVLICPGCARDNDLYIWGDPELLDRQDWTPEMKKAEADAIAIQKEIDRQKAEQEKKDAEVDGNKLGDNPTPA